MEYQAVIKRDITSIFIDVEKSRKMKKKKVEKSWKEEPVCMIIEERRTNIS